MTTQRKIRKNLNVSIQSKKFNQAINEVLTDWEDEGLNISTEVCKSILLANKIAKSPTLLNVMNIYDLAEKILNLYQVDEVKNSLEEIISLLINVNGSELTNVINQTFNGSSNTSNRNLVQTKKQPIVEKTVQISNDTNFYEEQKNIGTIPTNETQFIKEEPKIDLSNNHNEINETESYNFEYVEEDEYSIPDDILFNS